MDLESNIIEMAEEVKQEEQFERIVKITPAYDDRNKGCGIGACRMFMVMKGSKGCVTLTVSTAWHLRCTMEWKETCIERWGIETWEPSGMGVS